MSPRQKLSNQASSCCVPSAFPFLCFISCYTVGVSSQLQVRGLKFRPPHPSLHISVLASGCGVQSYPSVNHLVSTSRRRTMHEDCRSGLHPITIYMHCAQEREDFPLGIPPSSLASTLHLGLWYCLAFHEAITAIR